MKILLVCTGNTCRSAMAEGYLKHLLATRGRSRVEVVSAGIATFTGAPASAGAQRAAAEHGVDLSLHRSRQLSREDVLSSDWILVMEDFHRAAVLREHPEAEERTVLLGGYGPTPDRPGIPDPVGGSSEIFAQCSDTLMDSLEGFVDRELPADAPS